MLLSASGVVNRAIHANALDGSYARTADLGAHTAPPLLLCLDFHTPKDSKNYHTLKPKGAAPPGNEAGGMGSGK